MSKPKLDLVTLDRLLMPITREVLVYGDERDNAMLDEMDSAYQAERLRWCSRRAKANASSDRYDHFEILRNGSKNGIDECRDPADDTIIRLTKREASTYDDAECWLNVFAGRASMRAALRAVAK